ncbi:MAG: hypothetical protein AAGA99_25905, partial [Actinomycetota bacterium]
SLGRWRGGAVRERELKLVVASEHLAVTPAEHVAMQRAAVDASFMPDALRSELRAELDAVALP